MLTVSIEWNGRVAIADISKIAVSCFLPFRLKSIVKWRGSVSFPIYQNRGMEEEAHKRVTMSYDKEWGSCFFDKNQYLEDVLGLNLNSTAKLAKSPQKHI